LEIFVILFIRCLQHLLIDVTNMKSNETKSAGIEVSDIMIRQVQKALSDFERTSMIDAAILEFSLNPKAC